jgi:hypothetical protein
VFPFRRLIKTSPFGNKYSTKRPLPSNFAKLVYEECIRHNFPHILLAVFNFYIGFGDTNSRLLGHCREEEGSYWPWLLGEPRKDYFTWEMGDVLLYKEQALFLAEVLLPYNFINSRKNKEYDKLLPFADQNETWILKLTKGLKENANLLPNDPNQPSIFVFQHIPYKQNVFYIPWEP